MPKDVDIEAVMSQMLKSPDPAFRKAGEILREHVKRESRPSVYRLQTGDGRFHQKGGSLTKQGSQRGARTWDNSGPVKLAIKANWHRRYERGDAEVVRYELVEVERTPVLDFIE